MREVPKPLCDCFGVELTPDVLGRMQAADYRQALDDHGLILIRDRSLTPARQLQLSNVFGKADIHPIEALRHPECPELIVLTANDGEQLSESDPRGDEVVGSIPWHTDLTYTPKPPRGAVLYAVTVPEKGGLTGWIDTAHVYDQLPDDMKTRIEGLEIVHSFLANQAPPSPGDSNKARGILDMDFPDVIQPLVHRHPANGRNVLNISPLFSKYILGLEENEGKALLDELKAFATQDRFAYVHHWREGDVMIWDNWRTMHRAFGYPRRYLRVMHRTTIASDWQPGRYREI